MEKEKDIITTIQESKKFQDYNEGLQIVWDAIDKYGSLSKEAMEAVKKKRNYFQNYLKTLKKKKSTFR